MDPTCFVGIEIKRDRKTKTLFINQQMYSDKILERFGMNNCKGISTPFDTNQKLCLSGAPDSRDSTVVDVDYRQALGSLMYLMTATRPDLAYSVGILSRYCNEPRLAHWNAVKRVFRYIKETTTLGIKYHANKINSLVCWSDSDYAADLGTRKSISGYVITYCGGPVIWKSSKQSTVATSTCEAEFVAASTASKELIWLQQLASEMNIKISKPSCMFIDNQGAIKTITNNQVNSKSKHIDIKYMFIRELSQLKLITPIYIDSKSQLADIFTKAVSKDQFIILRKKLSIL